MKIVSFTNAPLLSHLGSGKTVLNFTAGLRQRGHGCAVYSPQDFDFASGITKKAKKIRHALGAAKLSAMSSVCGGADLVEFYGDEFWLAEWLLKKRRERPFLVAHTNGLELLLNRWYVAAHPPQTLADYIRWLFSKCYYERVSEVAFAVPDGFVALCEADREHIVRGGYLPEGRTAVVPPGLDRPYLDTPFSRGREKRVAFTGSWIARKGIDVLSQVMCAVMGRDSDVVLDIFGTGGSQNEVLACFPASLHERVRVHARLAEEEIAYHLSKARVFFFPSQYEGYGIAIAEAMACGCAAVLTPTGFGADLKDGVDALVCGTRDIDSFINAVGKLLSDDDLCHSVAWNGYQRVHEFEWEKSVDMLEAVYRRWVEEKIQVEASGKR